MNLTNENFIVRSLFNNVTLRVFTCIVFIFIALYTCVIVTLLSSYLLTDWLTDW